MASRLDILQRKRGEQEIKESTRYNWQWAWMDNEWVEPKPKTWNEKNEFVPLKGRYGLWFRKVKAEGKAYCNLCRKELNYGSRGVETLKNHAASDSHCQKLRMREGNVSLPGEPLPDEHYGVCPSISINIRVPEEKPMDPLVPVDDRFKQMEAMFCVVIFVVLLP